MSLGGEGQRTAQTGASLLVTIGYEGRTAEDLVTALSAAGVDVLADVRLTPVSRKRGLSKRGLSQSLADAGIAYLHLPALGNPRDNRDGFRAGEDASRRRFGELLRTDEADGSLADIAELLRQRRVVALLCFEKDVTTCHRGLVGDALALRVPGLEVRHL